MQVRSTSKYHARAILVIDNLQLLQFQVTQFQTHEILKQGKETEIIRFLKSAPNLSLREWKQIAAIMAGEYCWARALI